MHDLRYALRVLTRQPAVTTVAVLTLALGIGANTSVFSLVHGVLLRPFPFDDANRLVLVSSLERETGRGLSVSYPDFADWRARATSFQSLAAYAPETVTLSGGAGAERLAAELVSAGYFETLGVQVAIGRGIQALDDTAAASPAVVLSDQLWRRLGTPADVVGGSLRLNDLPHTIVGVAPAGFRGLTDAAQLWLPIGQFDAVNPSLRQFRILESRSTRWHAVVGRLGDETGLERAAGELATVAARLEDDFPDANEGKTVRLTLAAEALVGEYRASLLLLLAGVGFVLLVACANLANLYLARGLARTREFAVRTALGAGRARLVRQLMVESLLIAVLGGLGGLLVAAWSIPLVLGAAPVEFPSFVRVGLDAPVLIFTTLVTLLTGVACGVVPAMTCGTGRVSGLRSATGDADSGRTSRRWRDVFVVLEIAVVFVLLVGAGLMLSSFRQIQAFDPGFPPTGLLTLRIGVPPGQYGGSEGVVLAETIRARLAALPGVEAVGLSSHVMFGEGYLTARTAPAEIPAEQAGAGNRVYRQFVSPGFFEALGLGLVRGRGFSSEDRASTPRVAVVSASFARQSWPGTDALGRRFRFLGGGDDDVWTVVGVAQDVRPELVELEAQVAPQVYTPMYRADFGGTPGVLVRASVEPGALAGLVRDTLTEIDAEMPAFGVMTMADRLATRTARHRFSAWVTGLLAGLGVLLAAVGIGGVMLQMVAQRNRELGIRLSLGASPEGVAGLVVRHAAGLTAIGLVTGVAAAAVSTRALEALLFETRPVDPWIYAGVGMLMAAVALLACLAPVRRAIRIDPVRVLRND